MFQTSRKLPIGIFLATLLLMNSEASATQILRGKADDTLAASLSRVEPTLIRVDGHRIRHVFDAEGDFTVMPDKEAGTAYLKPMTDKPVFSAFVSDETGRTWKPRLSVIEGPLKGEKYRITNTSDKPMVVDERELYRRGVVAISIERPELGPGESSAVLVIMETSE